MKKWYQIIFHIRPLGGGESKLYLQQTEIKKKYQIKNKMENIKSMKPEVVSSKRSKKLVNHYLA